MKLIIRIITLLIVLIIPKPSHAQENQEITLTVSSDGPTKDEAVKNALRLAIEQAYGAFVSANTTILNDELVKDEIVTISNGAIKEYKIISDARKPDGSGYVVTANATVSLPHLVTYAKNHGSECEFAGNTFGMQMKLFELQKKNELKALDNLFSQVVAMIPSYENWSLTVDEPSVPTILYKDYDHTFKSICDTLDASNLVEVVFKLKGRLHPEYSQEDINKADKLPKNLITYYKSIKSPIHTVLLNGLKQISIPEEQIEEARRFGHGSWIMVGYDQYNSRYSFRNSDDEISWRWNNFIEQCKKKLLDGLSIKDNTGAVSDLNIYNLEKLKEWNETQNGNIKFKNINGIIYGYSEIPDQSGIFKYPFVIKMDGTDFNTSAIAENLVFYESGGRWHLFEHQSRDAYNAVPIQISLRVLISKEDIGKYSSFEIVKE
ncbi:MAG: hypothetical protein HDS11_02370 [Bacteroides sp.]|nr:hypothetical protein [Bacteroides sp.]